MRIHFFPKHVVRSHNKMENNLPAHQEALAEISLGIEILRLRLT